MSWRFPAMSDRFVVPGDELVIFNPYAYNPSQPRAGKGSPLGGQWIRAGEVEERAKADGTPRSEARESVLEDHVQRWEDDQYALYRALRKQQPAMANRAQQEVVWNYIGDSSLVNKDLRKGRMPMHDDYWRDTWGRIPPEKAVALMDDFTASNHATRNMIVYRGVDKAVKVGKVYRDNGFMSTSTSLSAASSFSSRTLLEVELPKGQRFGLPRKNDYEQEVVLPRGTKFKVVGRTEHPWDATTIFKVKVIK